MYVCDIDLLTTVKFSSDPTSILMMERYEKYIIKANNNLVGNASILESARNIVEAGDFMLVPHHPTEDVTDETSSSSISRSQDCLEEPIIVEDLESSVSDEDSGTDSSSDSDEDSEEDTRLDVNDNQTEEEGDSNRRQNSPMIFALPVDLRNGGKVKVKCMLCSKVITKKCFGAHIDTVHTSNSSSKCEVCGKLMLKKTLPMHMRSVHYKEKVNCDECGVELALSSLPSHKSWHKDSKTKAKVDCEECGAQMLRCNLSRHLKNVHGNSHNYL